MKTVLAGKPLSAPLPSWEKAAIGVLFVAAIASLTWSWQGRARFAATSEDARTRKAEEIQKARVENERLANLLGIAPTQVRNASAARAPAPPELTPADRTFLAREAALYHIAPILKKDWLRTTAVPRPTDPTAPVPRPAAYHVDSNAQLAPRFGVLFNVPPSQVSQLQSSLNTVRSEIQQFAITNTLVTQDSPSSYVLAIETTPDLERLRDTVVGAFQDTLGPEKYEIFSALQGERIRTDGTVTGGPAELFKTFGVLPGTITVTRVPTGFRYIVRGPGINSAGTVPDLDQLAERLPTTKLIPVEFVDAPPVVAQGRGGAPGGAAGGGGGGGAAPGEDTLRPVGERGAGVPAITVP